MLAHVEDGRLVRVEGDPAHAVTAGFLCAKVSREPELVHSRERVLTPLRRTGPKGAGRFAPISWEAALAEIVARWQAIIREDGPLALLGYCYSAHQGQINRWLPMALFHAMGATRLVPGTVCDSAADAGWSAAVGPVGGADPESVVGSDLVLAWGTDLVTTNVHFWAAVEARRKAGVPLIVIDPRRSRTAAQGDWHLPVRIDTDAALALGVMHVLVRDGLADREYLARETVGFERLEREVLPRFDPARVAAITGLAAADVERLAHRYGEARAPFIRLGAGMSRAVHGGQDGYVAYPQQACQDTWRNIRDRLEPLKVAVFRTPPGRLVQTSELRPGIRKVLNQLKITSPPRGDLRRAAVPSTNGPPRGHRFKHPPWRALEGDSCVLAMSQSGPIILEKS